MCVRDEHYEQARVLLKEDQEMVAWWATQVECKSAFSRLQREGKISGGLESSSMERMRALSGGWVEVQPSDAVRRHAERAIYRHGLKAMDALQLGAALEWVQGDPNGRAFVSFDQRLARAAAAEGFLILPG